MTGLVAETFAREWIAASNRFDVGFLTHYADEVVFVNPLAATVTGNPEVHGKDALHAYWTKALHSLQIYTSLPFESFVRDRAPDRSWSYMSRLNRLGLRVNAN